MLLRFITPLMLLSFTGNALAVLQNQDVQYGKTCAVTPSSKDVIDPVQLQQTDAGTIGVESRSAEILSDEKAYFTGNVIIQRNGQWLSTAKATIDQQRGEIIASNGIIFNDGELTVTGDSLYLDLEQDAAELYNSNYRLRNYNARGHAQLLLLSRQKMLLKDSSFTTCPGDSPAWQLRAERIEINETSDYGEAWHARFELFDVPVLYLPYFNFPLSDDRKTGLLFPTFDSSSNSGFEVEVPYYFNIAPNMDATISPIYMSERGTMLQGEYRYLFQQSGGQVNISYLNSDDTRTDEKKRYLWHVQHSAQLTRDLSFYLNATEISDDNYLNDFGSDFAGRADTHLYRVAQLDYAHKNWAAQLRTEDYELIGDYRSPFRTLPQLSVDYSSNDFEGFSASLYNELTHFENQNQSQEYATRAHIEPSIQYRYEKPAFDAEAELSYLYTHYWQESPDSAIKEEVTRALPRARIRARLHMERPVEINDTQYRQTLSPQIQYLYVPYENQQNIGIYDTSLLQDDYHGLFRSRRFSGLDRIAEANQVTYGVSSSFFTQNEREVFRASIGQIYNINNSRTELFAGNGEIETSSNSEWVADINWAVDKNWSLRSSIQYDTELNTTRKSQTAIEFRKDESNLVQVSHRTATNILNNDIEQVGTQTVWVASSRWQVAANVFYDLTHDRLNDAMVGVQYSSCCWALRVSAYRRINRDLEPAVRGNQTNGDTQFDNGISIQFIISGLASDNSGLINMLEKSTYGYRRPFYLSN
ncbi:LPS-assembly protein LptD [Idiomarina sp. HP20-50]|uniref:LPS-assembly protein LptD n=1 Tax=Idiomarina sp. HP20-50 TaxID=3070813 RepID=UPI00294AB62C|nr:LPS assembly protein LptD [Idiomarina sp. HP20-50]MDV6315583.1 LPS assembly protein LptD [Idiomarina sp. HP20-50]